MKSIVTGGAGFIGSHIVDALLSSGHEVRVIDNESSECHDHFNWNSNACNYWEDITNYRRIRHIFNDIDYVFHCAAESRIQPCIDNPLLAINTNTVGTGVILQCARESGVKKVIYSSTSAAYGLKNSAPMDETMPEDCLNPYSVTKVAGEKLCSMYTKLYGLNTVIFRYFNVYGEREPIKGPYAPIIGVFLKQARALKPLTIVPDGNQRRDFVHVSDVVDANMLAMLIHDDAQNVYGEVFNVGSGKNYSMLELAALISDKVEFIAPREGEAKVTLANIEKITNKLSWCPTVTLESYIQNELRRKI